MSAATVKKAWAAFHRGEMERAQELFRGAQDQAPTSALPCTQKGLFHLRQDQFQEAQDCFREALRREPENPAPLFFVVVAEELGDQPEQAQQSLQELLKVCPRHQGIASLELLVSLRRGNPSESLARLGFGAKPSQENQYRTFLAGLGMGDPNWLPPDLSSSDFLLGPILVEVETRLVPLEIPNLERAGDHLWEQLEDLEAPKRDWREELNGICKSAKAGSALKRGKRILERALDLKSLEEQREELGQAARYLRLARKLDPVGFRTSYYLGEAYLFSSKNDPGEPYKRFSLKLAENSFLESVRLDGVNPYVLFYLALCQHLLGRPISALKGYELATDKFAKLPEAHYGAGQCHLLLGDRTRARELLLKAANSDLALARERFTLLATLLTSRGVEGLQLPLPTFPEEEPDTEDEEPDVEPEPSVLSDVSAERHRRRRERRGPAQPGRIPRRDRARHRRGVKGRLYRG